MLRELLSSHASHRIDESSVEQPDISFAISDDIPAKYIADHVHPERIIDLRWREDPHTAAITSCEYCI